MVKLDSLPIRTYDQCIDSLAEEAIQPDDGRLYCNATFDTVLCWPVTPAGEDVQLHCPPYYGLDDRKFAFRRCGEFGDWDGQYPGDTSRGEVGWTNYGDCMSPEAMKIVNKYLNRSEEELEIIQFVLKGTRMLDMVGLILSFIFIVVSLVIFSYFRSLRCHRTRIHRNLFLAIGTQVFLRLVYYIDQQVARSSGGEVAGTAARDSGLIFQAPVMCEIHILLLEYSHTVMFMWMFIEGFYLHNMITVSVFSGKPNYKLYYSVAWGFPLPFIIAWVICMVLTTDNGCWELYYFVPFIWILESPRIAVLVVNLFFYINIIRILISKLRNSYSNEEQQVRKAVKAAFVLLPLLGMTNCLVMVEPPIEVNRFAAWSYISHFLVAFQGVFISVAYCFLNGEVRMTLRKRWERYWQRRSAQPSGKRRLSRSLSIFTSFTEVSHGSSSQQTKSRTPSASNVTNGLPLLKDGVAENEMHTTV